MRHAALFSAITAPLALFLSGTAKADSLQVVDISSLQNFGYGAPKAGQEATAHTERGQAYDRLAALTSIQGIVNRRSPNLFIIFSKPLDELWLTRIQGEEMGGGVLTGRTIDRLNSAVAPTKPTAEIMAEIDKGLDAAIETHKAELKGLAVWDENVPATLNAAFTAAGVEDLIVVRFDKSADSLYQKLIAKGFTPKVSLVKEDGSSLFVNSPAGGMVPGLAGGATHKSSGRAKGDAYLWASETYLKPKKTDPTEFGLMVDGIWVKDPLHAKNGGASPLNLWYVTNRDWLVSHRGFPFDFNPLSTTTASDDPGAPPGADLGVQNELLLIARSLAGNKVISVRGFLPWPYKYQTGGNPVDLEWQSVKNISPYGAGLDADAYAPSPQLNNATVFEHVPLTTTPEPQTRPTAEDLVGNGYLTGLANNGGFEDEGAEWATGSTNCTVYTDPTHSRTGMRLMQCNTANVGDLPSSTITRTGSAAAAGQVVTARTFLRAQAAGFKASHVIRALGGTEESAVTNVDVGTDWTEVRTTLTIANGGHTATRLEIYLGTKDKNLDIDDSAFYAGDAASGSVVPANYTMWLLGDHDSAAWYYSVLPQTWDTPGRGLTPFAWDFSGHPAPRIPPHFRHVIATRTKRDFFIGADSGPGYANPSSMAPEVRKIWATEGVRDARYLDTSAGWVLDPIDPLKFDKMDAVTPFYSDGILVGPYLPAGSDTGMAGNTPVIALRPVDGTTDVGFGKVASIDIVNAVLSSTTNPGAAVFRPYRVVALSDLTTSVNDATSQLVKSYPARKVRAVDPFSFFYLARKQAGGKNSYRASYKNVTLPTSVNLGEPINLSFTVHNDGWDTWRNDGANPVRAGVSVVDGALADRVAPKYSDRIDLPKAVRPGEELTLTFTIPAYAAAGAHTVQIDMVEELKTWFEAQGDIPLLTSFRVVDPTAISDGDAGDPFSPDADPNSPNGPGTNRPGGAEGGGCSCRNSPPFQIGGLTMGVSAAFIAVSVWRRRRSRG